MGGGAQSHCAIVVHCEIVHRSREPANCFNLAQARRAQTTIRTNRVGGFTGTGHRVASQGSQPLASWTSRHCWYRCWRCLPECPRVPLTAAPLPLIDLIDLSQPPPLRQPRVEQAAGGVVMVAATTGRPDLRKAIQESRERATMRRSKFDSMRSFEPTAPHATVEVRFYEKLRR
jgi:hypothetical protein